MTDSWEIVAGDFGGGYRAVARGLDLSDCIAKIYVWRDSTYLLEGKPDAGMEVTYDSDEDESYCSYEVQENDFPSAAAINDKRTSYNVMIRFTKDGYQEHDLGFEWDVFPAPPTSS